MASLQKAYLLAKKTKRIFNVAVYFEGEQRSQMKR
jgi:hypothetical protein